MELRWLELEAFRCHERLRFEPDPGTNILVGPNGAGKTSVLEAIAYLGLLRSMRGSPDEALIRQGGTAALIRGAFSGPAGETRVEVEIASGARRRVLLNGKRPPRNRDVLRLVPIVAFLPDDLDLVKRGPALRRDFLDDLAAQLRPAAGGAQQDYDKALRQRNALLRTDGLAAAAASLDVWDARIAAAGAAVVVHRRSAMDDLRPHLSSAHQSVGGAHDLVWRYESSWADPDAGESELAELFAAALGSGRTRDMERRHTGVGPHRDDPTLELEGRSLRVQASQGEQRTAALAMRMASYGVLAHERDSPPVLLLDDVLSELDEVRAAGVLGLLPRGQVLVTSARDDEAMVKGRRWTVSAGVVT